MIKKLCNSQVTQVTPDIISADSSVGQPVKYLFPLPLLLLLMLFSCTQLNDSDTIELNSGWKLHTGADSTISVQVPGMVHSDLFAAGLIPDPFYGENESKLQWIGERQWLYSLDFKVAATLLRRENVELLFEGLDTYASVWLNDSLILESDNMFRAYSIPVKELLKKDLNTLIIRFYPPDSISLLKSQQPGYALPEHRAYTRKAPFQAGWDWGPVFHTMGIWQSVRLNGWDKIYVSHTAIHQLEVNKQKAGLMLELDIQSHSERSYKLRITKKGFKLAEQYIHLKKGNNSIKVPFVLENPTLWWPNGMGGQHMSHFDMELFDGNEVLFARSLSTGLRSIELVQEADATGTSFFFRVNGLPMFAKGANYIPEDHFTVRMTTEKSRKLLSDAAAVHMNMIRVWGGGVYPGNDFYALCDSLGLLVWQDFMFACTMYPFDSAFLENVRHEAEYQVRRLRQHPSLALWCGNNEVSEGFHNWGWQQSLQWTAEQEKQIWEGYEQLFESLLPDVVKRLDPARPYWPSSPSKGWGRKESLTQGDIHYWGVWWGEEPFEMYEKKVGRFHSEYGFQAMPVLESLRAFAPDDQLFIGSPVLEAHQKHPRGTRLIDDYMRRDFPVPENFEDYVYVSQLVQAHGIVKAIEAHRRNKPITMGTLYWQLNDSWPVTSWSSVDYFGRWKALHFMLKKAFAPQLIVVDHQKALPELYLISDDANIIQARLEVDVKSMDGKILQSVTLPVELSPNKVKKLVPFGNSRFFESLNAEEIFLHCRIISGQNVLAEKVHFMRPDKQLKLPAGEILMEVKTNNSQFMLELSTDALQRYCMLSSNDPDGRFSDNFFDLIPGAGRSISFVPSGKVAESDLQFRIKSLNPLAPINQATP